MYFRKDFAYETDAHRPECHCSVLCELPSGNLFCVWYAGSREKQPDVALLGAWWSWRDGQWTPPRVLWDTPGKPEGNAVAFVPPDGLLHLFFVTVVGEGWDTAELKHMTSADEGETWSQPVVMGEPLGTMVRNKPLYLPDGRTILPMYDDREGGSFVCISDDGGATWWRSSKIPGPGGHIQPTLFQKSDGSLVALMRNDEPRLVQRSRSTDRGETWSAAESTVLPNPNAGCDVVAVEGGRLLLAFNDSPTRRSPLSIALSEDEGETWPLKVDLETDDAEFSYPSIIWTRDGLLHVSYTWRRKAIAHVIFDEEWFLANARPRV
ncbi:MAG: exo-alpha-sialidase [Armatimonadetes bacterium]|nr:exo-alpha-sialidase [Armatimonadota bacterium]